MRGPDPTKDMTQAKRDLAEFGYCLIEDALPSAQLEQVRDRLIDQAEAEKQAGVAAMESGIGYPDGATFTPNQRVWNLPNKGDEFLSLLTHPQILPLVRHVLGDGCMVSSFTANIACKGGTAQVLHTDQSTFPLYIKEPVVCNVAFMLSDFTNDNGATRIIPGSHLDERKPVEDMLGAETIAAEAPAGTAMVFEGRVWHGTGANITDDPRHVALAYYCKPWLRTQEAFLLTLSDAVLEKADDELKYLLGHGLYQSYGGVDGRYDSLIVDRSPPFGGRMTLQG